MFGGICNNYFKFHKMKNKNLKIINVKRNNVKL